jgi:hypothetical protein
MAKRIGIPSLLVMTMLLSVPAFVFAVEQVECPCQKGVDPCPSLNCGYGGTPEEGFCGTEPGWCHYTGYSLPSDCDMWHYPDDCGLIIEN